MTKNGIVCKTNGTTITLDPKIAVSGLNFVSHAHSDHLPSRADGTILSSDETRAIAGLRGLEMKDHVADLENASLHDTGHILGARGLLYDGIFYTGDICTRGRGFLRGARVPKCKILITECTFGLPEFIFPPIEEIRDRVNGIISDMYSRGIPVILMGYALGKAQTITHMFQHWEPFYLHDSIKKVNELHQSFNVNLREAMGHSEAQRQGLLDKKPWVMVAPMMSEKSSFVRDMKSKYDALTVGFSGWAKSSKFHFGRMCDYSIPLSDHCDFLELVRMVNESGAEKIYTVHGFVDDFADYLRKYRIDAQPLQYEATPTTRL